MIRANYHTHTYRCKHAIGAEEDYVKSAIDSGLKILGFSDHAPYKFDIGDLRMNIVELEEYIQIVRELEEKYKNQIQIKCGLEIEYEPKYLDYYKELLEDYKLDYLVLGQHYFTFNNKVYNTFCLDNTDMYVPYAKTIIEAMETGYFKYIAHPDVIYINDCVWDENCENTANLIINYAKENDVILEFNANGIRKGKRIYEDGERFRYPHIKFWEKVAKTNIRVIINADAHDPAHIWDSYLDYSYEMAKDLGLNLITEIF